MNAMDAMLAEFDQEAVTTRRLLESVPEGRYGWRAHEKGMSLGELCGHIGAVYHGMPMILGSDSFDAASRPGPQPAPADQTETLARFDSGISQARSWLAGLGDKAHEMWSFRRGETELMAMPRIAAIRALLFNHIYHHRGQLSGYLRTAGERVPSVYGPSADEDPFAE